MSAVERVVAHVVSGSPERVGSGTRTPFGWPVVASAPGEPLMLRFPGVGASAPVALRVTVALEVWRDELLTVDLGEHQVTAVADHCDVFEVIDIPLAAPVAGEVIVSVSTRESAVWFFGVDAEVPAEFRPQLIVGSPPRGADDAEARFLDRVAGRGSLQQFGWKEGCVLDGLLDLADATGDAAYRAAAADQLALFFDERGELRYEDPWGRPADGRVYGIEGALPFAAIERLHPGDPAIGRLLDYLAGARRDDGALFDEGMVSTEGAYTVAYPLALLGATRGASELIDDAVAQLRVRVAELTEPGALFLRSYGTGEKTYRNWIRAYTWYLIGLVRVLELPGGAAPDLVGELRRVAAEIIAFQGDDGLWSCFVDDPRTGTETSGSAGIAAALARGARAGLLDASAADAARRARAGLLRHITPDGYLAGASQANKDGERLQRRPYRILSQMGMGLLAQLLAALTPEPRA